MATITHNTKRSRLNWTPRQLKRQALTLCACGVIAVSMSPSTALASDDGSFWTQFTPSVDTRLIFVSSSEGSDSNSGLTPERPVKSLDRAYELLRDGYPDWMLLKRGDAWYENMPSPSKSGRSEHEPLVIGAYGNDPERPILWTNPSQSGMQAMGADTISNVAFVGLHLEPDHRADDQAPTGIRWLRDCNNILFEDMYIAGYKDNITFQAYPDTNQLKNIHLNGCVIVDAWSSTSHAQGMYVSGVTGLTIENSVFDHNGWNHDAGAEPTIFNHNVYVQNNVSDVIFKNNISSDASSHGVQLRCGGIINDNLFLSNPLAVLIGGGTTPNEGGVEGEMRRNLIMYGRDIDPTLARGFGVTVSNIRQATIANNYFHIASRGYNRDVIMVGGDRDLMVTNLLIDNNLVVNWPGAISVRPPAASQIMNNITISNNAYYQDLTPQPNGNLNNALVGVFNSYENLASFKDNKYFHYNMHDRPFVVGTSLTTVDEWAENVEPSAEFHTLSSPPPTLGIDAYLSSIELNGDLQDFIRQARQMSRTNPQSNFSASSVIEWFTSQPTIEQMLSAE